jgi:hypothetical protein
MLSYVRRERFLVITLPAVENKRSGAAKDALHLDRDATRRKDSWDKDFPPQPVGRRRFDFWFLVCSAATQLALQFQQERIQVVRSNKVDRRIPTEWNSTPTMDLGFEDIRMRRYTNKGGREQNTHP